MSKPPVRAQEVATLLAEQVQSGELGPGAWLPPERQLAQSHQVSRATARAAVQALADMGLVRLVPGAGAQVAQGVDEATGGVELTAELSVIRLQLAGILDRLDRIEAGRASPPTNGT